MIVRLHGSQSRQAPTIWNQPHSWAGTTDDVLSSRDVCIMMLSPSATSPKSPKSSCTPRHLPSSSDRQYRLLYCISIRSTKSGTTRRRRLATSRYHGASGCVVFKNDSFLKIGKLRKDEAILLSDPIRGTRCTADDAPGLGAGLGVCYFPQICTLAPVISEGNSVSSEERRQHAPSFIPVPWRRAQC